MPETFSSHDDTTSDDALSTALRDGLRRLPMPAVSAAAFDARVLAALARPPSVWDTLRAGWVGTVRPLLCGAACSLAVTLLALFWTLHTPSPVVSGPSAAVTPSQTRPLDMAAVDALLSRPNLGAASLTGWAGQSPLTIPIPPSPDTERRPRPDGGGRRASSRPAPALLTA